MSKTSLIVLALQISLYVVASVISAFCWDYSLNTLLAAFNVDYTVEWYKSAVLGFIPGLGEISIVLALITWIIF